MLVDTALLHSGAYESDGVRGKSQVGGVCPSRRPHPSGVFGWFASSGDFRHAFTWVHAQHLENFVVDLDQCGVAKLRAV